MGILEKYRQTPIDPHGRRPSPMTRDRSKIGRALHHVADFGFAPTTYMRAQRSM